MTIRSLIRLCKFFSKVNQKSLTACVNTGYCQAYSQQITSDFVTKTFSPIWTSHLRLLLLAKLSPKLFLINVMYFKRKITVIIEQSVCSKIIFDGRVINQNHGQAVLSLGASRSYFSLWFLLLCHYCAFKRPGPL